MTTTVNQSVDRSVDQSVNQTIPMPERTDLQPSPTDKSGRPEETVTSEEFKITGDSLVSKVKEWIHQGNIRRIILKNEEGRTLLEIPLTVGVIGTAIGATVSPEIVAVGVIGSMVAHLTVVIERQKSEH